MIKRDEILVPRSCLIEFGGFTPTDLTTFLNRNGIQYNSDGVPCYATIKALNAERKKGRFGKSEDVDSELKKERVLKERIHNNEALGLLIPKDRAKERVRTTLQAVANMIRYAIKRAAPKTAVCQDVRDCENIMIEEYNSSIELLETKAKDVTWEEDGTNNLPRRTWLDQDSEENPSRGSSEENTPVSEG